MNDTRSFEQQLASGLDQLAGPRHPVDAMAISRNVIAQSPKWRFQSMFSAAKVVVAGAIVALFGGFLLAGMLSQQPSTDPVPGAASPSASADLLSTLDTELVAPGVHRILGDGHRPLRRGVLDVAVDETGDVWVVQERTGDHSVVRLGQPDGFSLAGTDTQLAVDRDGGVRAWIPERELMFDGQAWADSEDHGDGLARALNWVQGDGFRVSELWCCAGGLVMGSAESADGFFHIDNAEYGFGEWRLAQLAAAPEGEVWAASGIPGTGTFQLMRFDGEWFRPIETSGPSGPTAPGGGGRGQVALATAPDGTLWISAWDQASDMLLVWSFDGSDWTSYDPIETATGASWPEGRGSRPALNIGIRFNPDGSTWFDGLVHYDGGRFVAISPPDSGPDAGITGASVAPDGTVWLAMGDWPDGCGPTPGPCIQSTDGLYVITREAVAAAE